jgi:hypothetical protein
MKTPAAPGQPPADDSPEPVIPMEELVNFMLGRQPSISADVLREVYVAAEEGHLFGPRPEGPAHA